jgi:hypothetical protein
MKVALGTGGPAVASVAFAAGVTQLKTAQSAPTFCTISETMCDLENHAIQSSKPAEAEHRLETQAGVADDLSYSWNPRDKEPEQADADQALAAPPSNMPFEKPIGNTNLFMDDYIQVGQGGPKCMRKLLSHLLKAVDRVLAQPGIKSHRNQAKGHWGLESGRDDK